MADTVKKKKNVQLNRIEIKCTNNIRGESGICCILRGKMLHNVSLFRDFFLSLVLTLNSPQSHPSKSQTRAPPPPKTQMQGRKQRIDLHPPRHAPPFNPSSSPRPQTHTTKRTIFDRARCYHLKTQDVLYIYRQVHSCADSDHSGHHYSREINPRPQSICYTSNPPLGQPLRTPLQKTNTVNQDLLGHISS